MIGIVVPETCWAYKKYNKIISSIWLVIILQLSQWCTVQQTSVSRLLIGMFPIRILTTTLTTPIENFCGFPQPLHENFGISPQIGHDYFLANPFQFFTFQSPYQWHHVMWDKASMHKPQIKCQSQLRAFSGLTEPPTEGHTLSLPRGETKHLLSHV